MKLSLGQFSALRKPVAVTIHSLDRSLYQMTVAIEGIDHLVTDNKGKTCRSHSLQQLRDILAPLPVTSVTLRHTSAYDEMVGQPVREGNNALEVPLSIVPAAPDPLH